LELLKDIDKYLAHRKKIAAVYKEKLSVLNGISFQHIPSHQTNVNALFPIVINEKEFGISRDKLKQVLTEHNIQAREYFPAQHIIEEESLYLPATEAIASHVLCLPMSSNLKVRDAARIADIISTAHSQIQHIRKSTTVELTKKSKDSLSMIYGKKKDASPLTEKEKGIARVLREQAKDTMLGIPISDHVLFSYYTTYQGLSDVYFNISNVMSDIPDEKRSEEMVTLYETLCALRKSSLFAFHSFLSFY